MPRPDAVPDAVAGGEGQADADSARTRPMSAPKSSSRTTGSSGALARRTNWTQGDVPRISLDSTMAVRKEKPPA